MELQLIMGKTASTSVFNYRWFSRRLHPERKGQRCRVVGFEMQTRVGGDIQGAWRGVRVQFEDGVIVSAERAMIKTAGGYRQAASGRQLGARTRR